MGGGKEERRVCEIYGIDADDIYSKSRQKVCAEVRGLYCYWAVKELGYELTTIARSLGMSVPGVGYALRRGEQIAKDNNYRLEK